MNFQQLRYVRETVRQGLNLTEAAKKLFTSQPGVSKQIRELENELGVEIFVRHGKRIVAVTEPGKAVVEVIERLLQEAENLKQVGREFKDQAAGTLTIATTHTQARYALPKVVGAFKRRYPKVHLTIKQGNPPQLAEMVIARERSEEHTSELQSRLHLVCRLLLEKKQELAALRLGTRMTLVDDA